MTRTLSKTDEIVLDAVRQCSNAFDNKEVYSGIKNGNDIAMTDLNIPSLERFEVLMMIEDALNIELDDDDVTGQESLFSFLDFVRDVASNTAQTAS